MASAYHNVYLYGLDKQNNHFSSGKRQRLVINVQKCRAEIHNLKWPSDGRDFRVLQNVDLLAMHIVKA